MSKRRTHEMKTILMFIKKNNACVQGYTYSLQFDDPKLWWEGFERGDRMLWFIGKAVGDGCRKKLILTTCQCARLVLPYVQSGEKRPEQAIFTTERLAYGDISVSLSDVRNAASAAYAAAYAADVADVADVAYVASYAASYAADAAAYAAYAGGGDATHAKKIIQKQCADIVRSNYSIEEVFELIEKATEKETEK